MDKPADKLNLASDLAAEAAVGGKFEEPVVAPVTSLPDTADAVDASDATQADPVEKGMFESDQATLKTEQELAEELAQLKQRLLTSPSATKEKYWLRLNPLVYDCAKFASNRMGVTITDIFEQALLGYFRFHFGREHPVLSDIVTFLDETTRAVSENADELRALQTLVVAAIEAEEALVTLPQLAQGEMVAPAKPAKA